MRPTTETVLIVVIVCGLDGSAFTFQSKYTYTIALTTTRNNILMFTITA